MHTCKKLRFISNSFFRKFELKFQNLFGPLNYGFIAVNSLLLLSGPTHVYLAKNKKYFGYFAYSGTKIKWRKFPCHLTFVLCTNHFDFKLINSFLLNLIYIFRFRILLSNLRKMKELALVLIIYCLGLFVISHAYDYGDNQDDYADDRSYDGKKLKNFKYHRMCEKHK
jgi:hypothetical protein